MKFSELGRILGGFSLCDVLTGTCSGYSDDCNTFTGSCNKFTGTCSTFKSPPQEEVLSYY
jgi:hypothetical protein